MKRPRHAVILAAGMGVRLRPITEQMPKCLTEVAGHPILVHELRALEAVGVEDVTIVVGYCGKAIVEAIGPRFGRLRVSYLHNERFAETNSMYSAWMARDVLERGAFLIEGDVVFDRRLLEHALGQPGAEERSFWLASRFGPHSEGSMSTTDAVGRIVEVRIVRDKLAEYPSNIHKSSGVLELGAEYGKAFSRWLDEKVRAGQTNIYYDLVLAEHLAELPLHVCSVDDVPWMEVDTLEDLRAAEVLFQRRKYVVVIMDGAADLPIDELGGKTPLEAAVTPTLDALTASGRTVLLQTMYPGVPVDSITAALGVLGYDPRRYYPFGRASFEAMAQDISLDDDDLAFRCNLVSLDAERRISDFTAGQIPTVDAARIINSLEIDGDDIELYSGQSYRNILVLRNAGCLARDIVDHAPHRNLGHRIADIPLGAASAAAAPVAERLNSLMLRSIEQVRRKNEELGTKADMIWLWSPSGCPKMPSFNERSGLRGAIVAGLDFMRGIGRATGMQTKEIHGATGYLDTAYREKLKYAKLFLQHNDFVLIHVNAADEEAHAGRVAGKIAAIENIDREVLGPLVRHLEKRFAGNYRIAVFPDHYTCLVDAQHLATPVPCCLSGAGVEADGAGRLTESAVAGARPDTVASTELFLALRAGQQ